MKINKVLKVLIALDYNPTAQKVAESGYSMAKLMDAEIILLHVISESIYYSSPDYSPIMGFNGFQETGPMQLDSNEGLKKAALQFLEKSKQHLGKTNMTTMVKEGNFAEAILKTAKEIHADIIILGSHSRKWLENVVIGSVTEQVLRDTTIPLIIIPTRKHN